MLKKLLPLIIIGILGVQGFSQIKPSALNELELYNNLKIEGAIPANFKFENPEILFKPTRKDIKKDEENDKRPTGNCGCYVTPDATYTLAMGPNDDGSTGSLAIPFNFCLYGTNYTSLYINNNGNISFGSPHSTFSSAPFPDPTYVMVAPFWGDVDTQGAGTVKYKITPTSMIINWDGVGYFSSQTDKLNTFQLIITDGTDPILPAGNNIAFCYGDMQWTTGSASMGVNGFGGTPATVGVNKGDGTNFIQLGRFDQPGSAYDGGGGSNDGVSWLDNQSFYFNVCSGSNIAPIANFTPAVFNGSGAGGGCDTLNICGINDTLIINSLFLSPEIGQTTTVAINLYGTPGFSILSNTPGNPANSSIQIIASPANAGMNTITYTATDDGIPAQTTIVDINIFVDTTGLSAFNPVINGVLEFCQGGGTTLTVTPNNLTSYIWNTGSIDTSISVSTAGEYWVTSELNGCFKTVNVDVIENPLPTPLILGVLANCTGGPISLYIDSVGLYTSYTWSNASTNDSIFVTSGTYSVTVIDTNGCSATSPSVTVLNPTVSITGSTFFCQDDSTTLTAVVNVTTGASFLWSSGDTLNTTNINAIGNVWVTVSYSNGCVISDTVLISVIPDVFSSQNDTICAGSNFTLPGGSIVTLPGIYVDTIPGFGSCDSIVTTNLEVLPIPTPVILGPTFNCSGNPITLYVDSSGLYASYNWSNGSPNDSINIPSGTYTITVTDSSGCSGVSPAVTVTIPSVAITGLNTFCQGGNTILTAVPTVVVGASYLWSTGDTINTISVSSPGNIWVTVTYTACSVSDTVQITMIPTVFTNQADTICQGDTYVLPGGTLVTTQGIYIDTIPGFTNCDSIITTDLTVLQTLDPTITADTVVCDYLNSTTFTAITGGGIWSGPGIINGSNGEFSPALSGLGQHQIIYTIGGTCPSADTVYINVYPSPDFSVIVEDDTCLQGNGSIVSTIISGVPPYSYSWSTGGVGPDEFNLATGAYTLTVADSNCVRVTQIFVDNFNIGCNLIAPNVITPNGDGENDFLFFKGLENYPGSAIKIYNRWGQLLFESNDYQNDWGPKDISDGTYYYVLDPGGPIEHKIITSSVSVLN